MHLSDKMSYLEAVLVHPVRRQNFRDAVAQKCNPYLIWCLMRNALEEGEHLSGRFQSIVNNSNEIPLFSNGSIHFSVFSFRKVFFLGHSVQCGSGKHV